jgi:hypothetical protein
MLWFKRKKKITEFNIIIERLNRIHKRLVRIEFTQENQMSALSDLQDKVTSLEGTSSTVVAAIADLKNQVATGASPEALNTLTSKVSGVIDNLNAALTAPTAPR